MAVDAYDNEVKVASSQAPEKPDSADGVTWVDFERDEQIAAQFCIGGPVSDETLERMGNWIQAQHGAMQRMSVTFVADGEANADVRAWQSEQSQDSQGKPVVRWVEVER